VNRNFFLVVIFALVGVFELTARADSLSSPAEPKRYNASFDWSPHRLTSTGLVYGRYPKGNWRAYRFQDDINGTTTGFGVGYVLQDTPLSSWLGDGKRLWTGLHYDPRRVKVDLAVETKSWSYSPKLASPISEMDTRLGNSEITDRSYRILLTFPF
jgi:hypothetical protein